MANLNNVVTTSKTQPTPKLSELLSKVKPDSVIVGLGSNYVKYLNDDFVKQDLKKMVQQIKSAGADCFWVTAPDMRLYRDDLPRLDKLIQESVGDDCRIFYSNSVTSYPVTGGDGVHYWFKEGTPMANQWADSVVESFSAVSPVK